MLLSGDEAPRRWGADAGAALDGVLWPPLASGLVLLAGLWALAALLLPWLVRGRYAGVDLVAATAWAAGLGAGTAAIAEWAGADGAPRARRGRDRGGRARLAAAPHAPAGYRERPAMSVLRNLESKLAGLVEGTFSRAFKSEVRPVEIARKLTREMEEHKVQSLSRTYAPNEYAVWLSPDDRKQFDGYERDLANELSGYLLEHARRERIALVTSPKITFKTDERLRLGEFGIQARLVRPAEDDSNAPSQGDEGHTMVYTASDRLAEPLREPDHRRGTARLRYEGKTAVLRSGGGVIGRSRDCEVVLSDQNVSRRHAEVRPSGGKWIVKDLGSTNGVKVNGRRITGPQSLQVRRHDRARHLDHRLRPRVTVELDPVAVALKFGFLAVLYLFLLWMARSAMKDLRRGAGGAPAALADDATGMHQASQGFAPDSGRRAEAARGDRGGVARRFRILSCRGRRARAGRSGGHPAAGHVRIVAARTTRAAGGRHGVGGSRIDERHVPERGTAARPAAPAPGGQDPDRGLVVHLRAMSNVGRRTELASVRRTKC